MQQLFRNSILFLCVAGIGACHKKDTYNGPAISDYMPLQTGHCYTYRLDSSVYTNFGSQLVQHSYIIKDSIETQVTDNTGRPSFRVVRYYRDALDSTVWHPDITYLITPTSSTIELVENNLRFIKLCQPVQSARSWSGNGYLPYDPYNLIFDFSSSNHLQLSQWDYIYQDIGQSAEVGNLYFDNTLSVVCNSPDSTNFPLQDSGHPGNKTYWKEQYAKGVGLVFKNIVFEEYQPPNAIVSNPYYIGFELKMSLLSYQ